MSAKAASENLFMKLRNIKIYHKKFWFYIKNQIFSTSISETKFMIGGSRLVSHEVYINAQYFFKQKKIKSSRREYVMWTCFKFWPIKNIFRKLWANEGLIIAFLQNLPRIVVAYDFSPSLFKLKKGILPLLTK